MRRVFAVNRTVLLKEDIGVGSSPGHLLKMGRPALVWTSVAMLAMACAPETRASPDPARPSADAQHIAAARNPDSAKAAQDSNPEAVPPGRGGNDESVPVGQGTTTETGRSSEQDPHWGERLSCELSGARLDIGLLQRIEQERGRAEWLEQDLAAARRDVEVQAELAAKAVEDAARVKQAAQGGAELQDALQQARERAGRLEQDLAAARRDVETQTALATQAGEEVSRLKRAGESGAASLRGPDEGERFARLEQDLAVARREVETQVAVAAKAVEEASRLRQSGEMGVAELRQGREKSARLEGDLAATRRDLETQTALATKAGEDISRLKSAGESDAAKLQASLRQERERSARLDQDLAAARRDLETAAALATKAGEESSRQKIAGESGTPDLQKERERSARLEEELAAARRDVEAQTVLVAKAGEEVLRQKRAVEAGASGVVALQDSLQSARRRADKLEQDLAAARHDVETKAALVAKAGEETSRLQATEKSAAVDLQKERERSAGLEQDLAAARRDVASKVALVTKTAEEMSRLITAGKSGAVDLQKERERSARLEQDLAAAHRDSETQTARAAKANEEVLLQKQAAEAGAAELRQLRARADAQAQSPSLARSAIHAYEVQVRNAQGATLGVVTTGSTAPDKSIEVAANPIAEQTLAAPDRADAQPASKPAAAAAGLVARASALLRQGDIGAARLVLERAVEMGSAQASFALAETYDPLVLAKWGTYGTLGNASRAKALYAQADSAGIKAAKVRLEALRR